MWPAIGLGLFSWRGGPRDPHRSASMARTPWGRVTPTARIMLRPMEEIGRPPPAPSPRSTSRIALNQPFEPHYDRRVSLERPVDIRLR